MIATLSKAWSKATGRSGSAEGTITICQHRLNAREQKAVAPSGVVQIHSSVRWTPGQMLRMVAMLPAVMSCGWGGIGVVYRSHRKGLEMTHRELWAVAPSGVV